jgi:hypothetical protein
LAETAAVVANNFNAAADNTGPVEGPAGNAPGMA